MLDRILLVSLLILLPVGVLVSKSYFAPKKPDTNEVLEQINRLEELLAKSDTATDETGEPVVTSSVRITSLSYATDSGTLTIEGVAAYPSDVLWTQIAQFVSGEEIPELVEAENKTDDGVMVVSKAFRTKSDNRFVFEHTFLDKRGVVDIVMWQKNERLAVRYSLDENRQLL